MMDELEPKEMIEVVEFIKSKTKPKDMTQTAVDWLVNVVQSCIAPNFIPKEIIEEAKEMEKQQMKEKYIKGIENYDPTFKKK